MVSRILRNWPLFFWIALVGLNVSAVVFWHPVAYYLKPTDHEISYFYSALLLNEGQLLARQTHPGLPASWLLSLITGFFQNPFSHVQMALNSIYVVMACLHAVVAIFLFRTLKAWRGGVVLTLLLLFFTYPPTLHYLTTFSSNTMLDLGVLALMTLLLYLNQSYSFKKVGAIFVLLGILLSTKISAIPFVLATLVFVALSLKAKRIKTVILGSIITFVSLITSCALISYTAFIKLIYFAVMPQQLMTAGNEFSSLSEALIAYYQTLWALAPHAAVLQVGSVFILLVFSCQAFIRHHKQPDEKKIRPFLGFFLCLFPFYLLSMNSFFFSYPYGMRNIVGASLFPVLAVIVLDKSSLLSFCRWSRYLLPVSLLCLLATVVSLHTKTTAEIVQRQQEITFFTQKIDLLKQTGPGFITTHIPSEQEVHYKHNSEEALNYFSKSLYDTYTHPVGYIDLELFHRKSVNFIPENQFPSYVRSAYPLYKKLKIFLFDTSHPQTPMQKFLLGPHYYRQMHVDVVIGDPAPKWGLTTQSVLEKHDISVEEFKQFLRERFGEFSEERETYKKEAVYIFVF